MSKLDLHSTTLTYTPRPTSNEESVRRLIVLVPKDMLYGTAIRQIWELAHDTQIHHVQLLGLCEDAVDEPGLRRGLVTMMSLLQDDTIVVEIHVDIGTSWVNTVLSHWQANDVLVCCAEHRTGLLHRPLRQILQSDLDVPLYILSGSYAKDDSHSTWRSQAAAWIGSTAIIAGFFVLQTRISLLTDWSQNILMLLCTAVEIWAIWAWNSLFH